VVVSGPSGSLGSEDTIPTPSIPSAVPTPRPNPSPSPHRGNTFSILGWAPWPAQFPGAPSAIVSQGPHRPIIALTIDDGFDPAACRQEFDYLRSNRIQATFFPAWTGVIKDPALWREIARAGYPIGNHTLTHANLAHRGLAARAIRYQLGEAQRRITALIGRPMLPVWRPPGGAYNQLDLEIAGKLGLHTMLLWSNTDADTALRSKPSGMLRDALEGGDGTILLTHCNRQLSVELLPKIVQGYLKRGFRFVTVPRLLRPYGLGG
jgi:peptidoglycan/xylan/chitin deacetylase (PgdA/CDA1 family)